MSDHQPTEPELLIEYLKASSARCPSCRYALRGCETNRCPECGFALEIQIACLRTTSMWWIAAIFGASINAALALLMLGHQALLLADLLHFPGRTAMVQRGVGGWTSLPNWRAMWVMMVLSLLCCLVLAWLLGARRRFCQSAALCQIVAGLVCLGSPLLLLGFLRYIATSY